MLDLPYRFVRDGAAFRAKGRAVVEVIGAIILVVAIILAAVLAVIVTRWALHMNE
jgi:hypothetical protein